MAISRAQLAKELEPGLNALFGLEYARYDDEASEIYDTESSERAFEEEVMLSGFGSAPVKAEGSAVSFDDAQEAYTARYTHETIALAFSITEEAIEDNLYDRLASRYTKALARSMANTKQVKGAATLNNAFDSTFTGGDGKELCATDHPLVNNNDLRNEPSTAADLNETSLENALIDIAAFVDERRLTALEAAIITPRRRFSDCLRLDLLKRYRSCDSVDISTGKLMLDKIADAPNSTFKIASEFGVMQKQEVRELAEVPVGLRVIHIGPERPALFFPVEPTTTDPVSPQRLRIAIEAWHRLRRIFIQPGIL